MSDNVLSEVLSSANSLGIAALITTRPRTQSELAEITGVSIPAVFKHLRRLMKLGLVKEITVSKDPLLKVRRVYAAKGSLVADFSQTGLRVVKLVPTIEGPSSQTDPASTMEVLSETILLQKRRVREQVKRLSRMIDDLLEDQSRLSRSAEAAGRSIGERIVLETIFTEEDVQEGRRALAKHYGLKGGRRSIEGVLAETEKIAKK